MLTSTGIIRYRKDKDGLWVTVEVSQDLANYYLSLIPKAYKVMRPRWPAHVTVIRPEENSPDISTWKRYEGDTAQFVYDPLILEEKGFWWFNLWSKKMEKIRLEFGLSIKSRITVPPPGYIKCFHCTVGNTSQSYL